MGVTGFGGFLSRRDNEQAVKTMKLWSKPIVKIISVSYTEARLISTAQFENARVEIGVTISLEAGESPELALNEGKAFVRRSLLERISDMMATARKAVMDDEGEKLAKKYRL